MNPKITMRLFFTLMIIYLLTVTALAQDTPVIPDDIDTSSVSDDAVNAIAEQLYCPVCENIPLDTCGTAACADWREEIRGMLAMGIPEEEIIDNFVTRFGDRVVGTPRDPVIRAISIVTPWIAVILAIVIGVYTIMQWQKTGERKQKEISEETNNSVSEAQSKYRERLEKDLAG